MQNTTPFPIWLLDLSFLNIASILKLDLSPTYHHSACLRNGCPLLAARDIKAVIVFFVCHLQTSLSVEVYTHTGQKNSLIVLLLFSIAAVKGITMAAATERYLLIPGVCPCFLICPFCATLVCVPSKWVQIQPQTGTRSSTWNTTLCVVFLIRGCLVGGILQNKCLTVLLPKPVGYDCTSGFDLLPIGRGEESLLLQHKYGSGMWRQIPNS